MDGEKLAEGADGIPLETPLTKRDSRVISLDMQRNRCFCMCFPARPSIPDLDVTKTQESSGIETEIGPSEQRVELHAGVGQGLASTLAPIEHADRALDRQSGLP